MPSRSPPLDVELSRQALNACRADPALMADLNAVLLRATSRLRARMGATSHHLTVRGRREGIVLEVVLTSPDRCRVEQIARRPEPGGADIEV